MKNSNRATVPDIGAHWDGNATHFCVWAPKARQLELYLPAPVDRLEPMQKRGEYWEYTLPDAGPGTRYFYRINGADDKPDPASRYQPDGVHGPSQVVSSEFDWTDHGWCGFPLGKYVLYELHVGTYTEEGTFGALIPHLENLKELGITAIELMPVAQFPGARNWGYDAVYPFAPQNSYGSPAELKKLVNAAHLLGLAVVLDVIYNHLGPEGNYFSHYGPYFTGTYRTPWGDAINFDGAQSGAVRNYFLANAEYWIREFHIDGLRLDAAHEMHDASPRHILAEIQERVTSIGKQLNRHVHVFAESDANDIKYLAAPDVGGYGLEAQWMDDFHHAIYTQMAETKSKHYDPDYAGMDLVQKAWSEGFVYSGQYCPTRQRTHGTSSRSVSPERFVVFIQNHDQVGNKPRGTRLPAEASYEAVKMAAATYILSPYLPMLFMGEELLEARPFLFFADHSDPALLDAVREGRRKDFMTEDDTGEFPDPFDLQTFKRCIIDHQQATRPRNAATWQFYRELLRLRRELPAICPVAREQTLVRHWTEERCLLVRREDDQGASILMINFSQQVQQINLVASETEWPCHGDHNFPPPPDNEITWQQMISTADTRWHGPGTQAPKQLKQAKACQLSLTPETAILYAIK